MVRLPKIIELGRNGKNSGFMYQLTSNEDKINKIFFKKDRKKDYSSSEEDEDSS